MISPTFERSTIGRQGPLISASLISSSLTRRPLTKSGSPKIEVSFLGLEQQINARPRRRGRGFMGGHSPPLPTRPLSSPLALSRRVRDLPRAGPPGLVGHRVVDHRHSRLLGEL